MLTFFEKFAYLILVLLVRIQNEKRNSPPPRIFEALYQEFSFSLLAGWVERDSAREGGRVIEWKRGRETGFLYPFRQNFSEKSKRNTVRDLRISRC